MSHFFWRVLVRFEPNGLQIIHHSWYACINLLAFYHAKEYMELPHITSSPVVICKNPTPRCQWAFFILCWLWKARKLSTMPACQSSDSQCPKEEPNIDLPKGPDLNFQLSLHQLSLGRLDITTARFGRQKYFHPLGPGPQKENQNAVLKWNGRGPGRTAPASTFQTALFPSGIQLVIWIPSSQAVSSCLNLKLFRKALQWQYQKHSLSYP